MAGVGHVHGVLGEDHRIVVGEGHALAAQSLRRLRDRLRAGRVGQAVHVARLGDVPVLAELAGEVAAGGAEGEHAGSRVEVVERFLLDRIDAEAGRAPVGGEHHLPALAHAHEAQAALALVQAAVARAQVALHPAVVAADATSAPGSWLSATLMLLLPAIRLLPLQHADSAECGISRCSRWPAARLCA